MRKRLNTILAVTVVIVSMLAIPNQISGQSASPAAATDPAANKELVRRYYEIAGSGDLNTLTEVVAPDLVIRAAPPGEGTTLESLTQTLAMARAGLPDFSFRIDDLIAEGNLVVARTTISGTHRGNFFGAPPTGKRIETEAIDIWRIGNGKLIENWHFEDILGVIQQLGVVPRGAATPASANLEVAATPTPGSAVIPTADAATMAENAALARRFREEIIGHGQLAVADEILAPGFVWHDVGSGANGVKRFATGIRGAFPDLSLSVDQVITEGDRVVIVWTMSGTHRGEYSGVPATGKHVSTSGADIYRIENGKIAEIWTVGDDLGLLMQLGAMPSFGGNNATPGSDADQ